MYDYKNLNKLSHISGLVPEEMKSFEAFESEAMSEGVISKKNKELIAIAVALTTQCSYCIEYHRRQAIAEGASEQELAEVSMVAVAMKAGAAITHATHLFKNT